MTKDEQAHFDQVIEENVDSQEASSPDKGSVATPTDTSRSGFDYEKNQGTQTFLSMSREPFST